MLANLQKYKIVLASNSPRRRELLSGLGLGFEVRIIQDIDESYPDSLLPGDIPVYIAAEKAKAYMPTLADDELLITADTIVWASGQMLGKPTDRNDAIRMLSVLSGREHEVVTGVCLYTKEKSVCFSVSSSVRFARLTDEEIGFYVDNYDVLDKAGAYGIQEWIGYIGVEAINGSFYNVMGLPVQRVYKELKAF